MPTEIQKLKQERVAQASSDTLHPTAQAPTSHQLRRIVLDLFHETMEERGREALYRLIEEKPEVYFTLAVKLLPNETKSTVDVRHSIVETVRRSRELRGADISVESRSTAVVERRISGPDSS